jgi:hypothetical protein
MALPHSWRKSVSFGEIAIRRGPVEAAGLAGASGSFEILRDEMD